MTYNPKTQAELYARKKADFKNTIPAIAVSAHSEGAQLSATQADGEEGAHRESAWALRQAFPPKADFDKLKMHAKPIIGDPDPATIAEGQVKVSGIVASAYTAGDELTDDDGNLYELSASGVIPPAGYIFVNAEAQAAGSGSLLTAGASLTFTNPAAGIDPIAAVETDWTGGAAEQTRESYLAEYLQAIRRPTVANPTHPAYDYAMYARLAEGVDNAKSHRLRRGAGTVDVCVWGPDRSHCNAATIAVAQTYVSAQRAPNCGEDSHKVYDWTEKSVQVSAQLDMAEGYEFSDIGANKTTQAGSTAKVIELDAVTDIDAGEYIAIGLESRKVETVGIGSVTVEDEFSAAPAAGLTVRAGCQMWDTICLLIKAVFDDLESGDTLKYGKISDCFWQLEQIADKQLDAPLANVEAHVDADKIQMIVLDEDLDLRKM